MAATREVVGYVTTSTGLMLNCSGFAGCLLRQSSLLYPLAWLCSTHTQTGGAQIRGDWLNNPFLPHNEHWTHAWFLFATIGTILTVTFIFHDTTVLLYSWYV